MTRGIVEQEIVHGGKKLKQLIKKQGFTLVELIIVIAIIAVLAVAAFMMLTKWLGKSRDSRRLGDMGTINKTLSVWLVDTDNTNGTLPLPDDSVEITYSGSVIGYQGKYGKTVIKTIGNMTKVPVDPSDTARYTYRINENKTKYELYGLLEKDTVFIGNEVLALDYSNRKIVTKGYKLGVMTDDKKVPIEDIVIGTGIELKGNGTIYLAWLDDKNKIEGDGSILQALDAIGENGFEVPKNCKEGFIGVPGNIDFNQAGFCIAKYEMSYAGETEEASRETTIYSSSKNNLLTSKAGELAISRIRQQEAIDSCRSLGAGYHLITNNERMTIARNIEKTASNWSNGSIGSGYISNGISNDLVLGCDGDEDGTKAERTGSDCGIGNKNVYTLSNGEQIWDLVGNVREHVDRSNNPHITTVQVGDGNLCNASGYWHIDGDAVTTCATEYGPIHNKGGTNIGMGYIWNNDDSNKIFLRGGGANNNDHAGIFALYLDWLSGYRADSVGFRCAK